MKEVTVVNVLESLNKLIVRDSQKMFSRSIKTSYINYYDDKEQ